MNIDKVAKQIKRMSEEQLFASFIQVAVSAGKAEAHTYYMARSVANDDNREIRHKVAGDVIEYQGYEICYGDDDGDDYRLMTRYNADGEIQCTYRIYHDRGKNVYVKRQDTGVESYYCEYYQLPLEYQKVVNKVLPKSIRDRIIIWSRKPGFPGDGQSFTVYIGGDRFVRK